MTSDDLGLSQLDLFTQFAEFGHQRNYSLSDPRTIRGFTNSAGNALKRALANPILLHGQRTQAMFEAMLVSLGEYSLLKAEDNGRIYPEGHFLAPDFRVVLLDGTQWLIEVKNVYVEDPLQQKRRLMTRAYREKLEKYASVTGGLLKLAVFWARWGIWTLVSPERLVDEEGNLILDIETSFRENELGYLGDLSVGTRPPLRLRIMADPTKSGTLVSDGIVDFTSSEARIYCGDYEVLDPIEKQIAGIFMQYGEWRVVGPEPIVEGDRLIGVEYWWEPEEQKNVGFEMIGTLSRMFSRYYAEQTIENAEIVQLRAPVRPEWFAPFGAPDYKSKALPLWQFKQVAG